MYGMGGAYSRHNADRLFKRLVLDNILMEDLYITNGGQAVCYISAGPKATNVLFGQMQVNQWFLEIPQSAFGVVNGAFFFFLQHRWSSMKRRALPASGNTKLLWPRMFPRGSRRSRSVWRSWQICASSWAKRSAFTITTSSPRPRWKRSPVIWEAVKMAQISLLWRWGFQFKFFNRETLQWARRTAADRRCDWRQAGKIRSRSHSGPAEILGVEASRWDDRPEFLAPPFLLRLGA